MKNILSLILTAICILTACSGENKETETAVSSLTMNQPSVELLVGETIQLSATVVPSNATQSSITWSTSKPSVASVSNSGLVKALETGNATITAAAGGKTASCNVTVTDKSGSTPDPMPGDPEVAVTEGASSITECSAKFLGHVNLSSGQNSDTKYGFEYTSTDFSSEVSSIFAENVDSNGKFSATPEDLKSNTTYYYRAFIQTNGVRTFGDAKSLKTPDFTASVSLTGAEDVTYYTAVIKGKVSVSSVGNLTKAVTVYCDRRYSDADGLIGEGHSYEASVSSDGSFFAEIPLMLYNTEYHYTALAVVHDKEFKSNVKTFKTEDFPYYAEAVDLGLSANWSTCNLGSLEPWERGFCYAWGETEEKDEYTWENYKWGKGQENSWVTKYCTNPEYGPLDNKIVLDPEDDVAHVKLGGEWRMPTREEIFELMNLCTWEWYDDYKGTGAKGFLVTSNMEGFEDKSIFLPTTFFNGKFNDYRNGGVNYSTSSLGNYSMVAWEIIKPIYNDCLSSDINGPHLGAGYRMHGRGIRPVCDSGRKLGQEEPE